MRAGCWLRSDSVILDEPIQIEQLANRPPWLAAVLEDGYYRHYRTDAAGYRVDARRASTSIERTMLHALDVGANYWSLWTEADNLRPLPRARGRAPSRRCSGASATACGRRGSGSASATGPSELVVAFANDGVAGVPGRAAGRSSEIAGRDGAGRAAALDAGHPHAGRLRQASFVLPPGLEGRERAAAGRDRDEGRRAPAACAGPARSRSRPTARCAVRADASSTTRGGGRGSEMSSHRLAAVLSRGRRSPCAAAAGAPRSAGRARHRPPRCCSVLARRRPRARGSRRTSQSQLDRAWALRTRRGRTRFARVQTEADLARAAGRDPRAKALDVIGGLPDEKTPLNARVTGIDPDGRLPHREARVREPARAPRHGPRSTCPTRRRGPKPAVLVACGHSPVGKAYATTRRSRPPRAPRVRRPLAGTRSARASAASSGTRRAGAAATTSSAASTPSSATSRRSPGTSLVRYEVWDGIRARRLPADPAGRGRRSALVDHRARAGAASSRRGSAPSTSGSASSLPSCFVTALPHADGQPHLRGPGQRPRAGPARARLRGRRPPRAAAARVPAAAARLRRGPRLRPDRGGARGRCARSRALLPSASATATASRFAQGYHEHRYSAENQERAFAFLDRATAGRRTPASPRCATLPPEALRCTPTRPGARGPRRPLARRRDPRRPPRASGARPRTSRSLYRAAPGGRRPGAGGRGLRPSAWESATIDGATIDRYVLRQRAASSCRSSTCTGRGAAAAAPSSCVSLPGKIGPADWPAVEAPLAAGRRGRVVRPARHRRGPACATGPSRSTTRRSRRPTRTAAYADPLSGVLANHVYNALLPGRPYLLEMIDDVEAAAVFCRETLGARAVRRRRPRRRDAARRRRPRACSRSRPRATRPRPSSRGATRSRGPRDAGRSSTCSRAVPR